MTTMVKKCEVEGCKNSYYARGRCGRHYRHWLFRTFPNKKATYIAHSAARVERLRIEDRKGYNAYRRAHAAVKKIHGPASLYTCKNFDECNQFAQHWALNKDSKKIENSKHFHWSENPADYMAMCVVCHKEYDRRFKNARNND